MDICNEDLYILDAADDNIREEPVSSFCITEDRPHLEIAARSSLEVPSACEDNNNTIIFMKARSQDSLEGRRSEGDDDSSREGEEDCEENGNRPSEASPKKNDSSSS